MQHDNKVGVFFSIGNKKYVTEVNYKSKSQFEKLLKNYTQNVKSCNINNRDKVTYVTVDSILNSAYHHLNKKQRANKLLINLMAQNSTKIASR